MAHIVGLVVKILTVTYSSCLNSVDAAHVHQLDLDSGFKVSATPTKASDFVGVGVVVAPLLALPHCEYGGARACFMLDFGLLRVFANR